MKLRQQPTRFPANREGKRDGDSMGMTSKRARETAKRKGNDETNTMVCSPSAKDERWRRKSSPKLGKNSPELGKMTEATPDLRD
jgi:hypothetical protein